MMNKEKRIRKKCLLEKYAHWTCYITIIYIYIYIVVWYLFSVSLTHLTHGCESYLLLVPSLVSLSIGVMCSGPMNEYVLWMDWIQHIGYNDNRIIRLQPTSLDFSLSLSFSHYLSIYLSFNLSIIFFAITYFVPCVVYIYNLCMWIILNRFLFVFFHLFAIIIILKHTWCFFLFFYSF